MKKICFLFESLKTSNGVAKAALAMANLLAESGQYQVDLIPMFKCEPLNRFGISPNVKVQTVFGFYFKGFAKLLDLLPDRLLYRMVIRKRYDIEVGFQYGLYTKIVSASTNKKAKHIAWMHGYDYGLKLRMFYPKFDKVLCVSQFNADRLKKELEQAGLYANVDYCYNVIDDSIVREKGCDPVSEQIVERPLLVTVGRFSPEKGFPRLVTALHRLYIEGYHFTMWFVGDGLELSKCKSMFENEQAFLSSCVFLGSQINPHKYTSKADLFICSSYSEGYSNACTEAIMLGVPVFSTSVPGANEIVGDSKAGMVVNNDDESLYQGLKQILDNPSLLTIWKKSLMENQYLFSKEYRSSRVFSLLES